jgi:hypothetical protein
MSDALTVEQKATNYETMKHIQRVHSLMNTIIHHMMRRALEHDSTKLSEPEVQIFTEFTSKLAKTSYPSKEYDECREQMKPALDHHYANSRHHPEHFKNGINEMHIVDIIEMLCDFKAASERQHDGNLRKSLEAAATRFGINPQLLKILENSVELFDK